MAGTRWRARTAAQRQATAAYVRDIRPVLGVWSEVLQAITSAAMLDIDAHFYCLLKLRSELAALAVPPDGEYAHVALIAAFEQTLLTCATILTRQPRDVIDRARDAALISFNAFEVNANKHWVNLP
jgi:hypothetical protein